MSAKVNNAQLCTYNGSLLTVKIPAYALTEFQTVYDKSRELHNGYVKLDMATPRKARTTGRKSQNHAINGFCQQIAVATGNDFETVKITAKHQAISRGYPFDTIYYTDRVTGLAKSAIDPWSETKIDTIQAGHLIDELKQIADELDIRLVEVTEE